MTTMKEIKEDPGINLMVIMFLKGY